MFRGAWAEAFHQNFLRSFFRLVMGRSSVDLLGFTVFGFAGIFLLGLVGGGLFGFSGVVLFPD